MSSESETEMEVQLVHLKERKKKANASKEDNEKQKETSNSKLTTKEMVNQALTELKNRKGTSLHAIKKYLKETYKIDSAKLNTHIKRYIKISVENGTIIQTKGTGASGSFKLVIKEKKIKTNVEKKKVKAEKESREKEEKKKQKELKIVTSKPNKTEESNAEIDKQRGKKQMRFLKTLKTPSKVKTLAAKRKSIGSIIKPPKMKPLATINTKSGKKK